MDSTTGSCLLPAAAAAMAGIDTGACIAAAASLTNPFVHSVQGLEEMQHLLMCATLELESARAVASAEVELHDGQVRHLQQLLAAAQRERDEAREQFLGLQSCLSRSPSMNGRAAGTGSTPAAAAPGGRTTADHSLPCNSRGLSGVMSPSVQDHHEQQQQLDMEELQMHLEILQDDHLDNLEELDLDSAMQQTPHEQQLNELDQSSCRSLQHHLQEYNFHQQPDGALHDCESDQQLIFSDMQQDQLQSDQQRQQVEALLQEAEHQQVRLRFPADQPLQQQPTSTTSLLQQQFTWPRQSFAAGFSQPPAAPVLCSAPPPLLTSLPTVPSLFQTQESAVSSQLLGILDHRPAAYEGTGSTGLLSLQQQQQRPTTLVPMHVLPEPPEADLQVMLSSLPEKGKLMQAVMDAGPLLQTLLMASSPQLPQWRHPPKLGLQDLTTGLQLEAVFPSSCMSFSSSTSCDSQTTAAMSTGSGIMQQQQGRILSQPPKTSYGGVQQHRPHLHRLSSLSSSHPSRIIKPPGAAATSAPAAAAHVSAGFSSVQRSLRRVNSMGHLMSLENMALNNQPRKYTKIY
ncbi:hypothetical protein CY35_12G072000 [Sphagnum magellanicum]|nr:hypothetical protein CY35_12G072000 [Sphagnum magellanicum]